MLVRKTVTVLFCDVVTSSEYGERLDPESWRRVMSRFFDEMQAVIERHGGTVEKFIGDEVMAVFGVPSVHEDDALRAVRAAAEMRDRLGVLNDELDGTWGVKLQTRIGVNTGEVVAGDPATGSTFVTGDAVNLGKRLEQAAGPGEILIGKATYPLVKDAVTAGPLESFTVKGKTDPVSPLRLDDVDVQAPGFRRRFDAPLVGRRAELALLEDAFHEAVQDRSCQLVTVLGPAGIGKTRLAVELCETLGDTAAWLTGRCLPYGDGITFWPLVQIVQQAGGEAAIAKILEGSEDADVVGEIVGGTIGPSPAAAGSDETFWGVRRFFEAIAAKRPLVVCLEDIHWAEPTFLDLIEYLAGWSRGAAILLLCLARPDLLENQPDWSTPRPNARLFGLEPLSEPEADALLEALGGDIALSEPARRRIAAASEGNPLFVEQMVAMAAENGTENGELRVPPSIHALLAERLDRLSAKERAVAERASVIGKEFVRRHILHLCPEELRREVGHHLMALVRKELIQPDRSAAIREDGFRFRHALIRDAAYDGLPKEIRADLHERHAAQVEEDVGERTEFDEIIGYHLEQSVRCRADLGRLDASTERVALRAGKRLGNAGQRAFARGDVPGATKLLERAASLLGADRARRSEVLLDLGGAIRELGDALQADAVLNEAEEVARAAGDERLELRALIEHAALRLYRDPTIDSGNVLEIAERATPVFEAHGDERGLARAWGLAADAHWVRSRFGAMEPILERARDYAERAGDRRQLVWILGAMCRVALVGPRPVDEGIRRCTDILERERGEPALQPEVHSMLAVLEAMRGRPTDAREHYRRSSAAFEELGQNVQFASHQMYAGWAELISGDAIAAERELRHGYDALERMGESGYLSTTAAFLARALFAQGRYDEAQRLTHVSEDVVSEDDLVTKAMWRGTRARTLALAGDATGERLARDSVEIVFETDCINMQADALVDLSETLRLLGRHRETTDIVDEAIALYEMKGNLVSAAAVPFPPTEPSAQVDRDAAR